MLAFTPQPVFIRRHTETYCGKIWTIHEWEGY